MKYTSIILGIVSACLSLPLSAQVASPSSGSSAAGGANPHTTVKQKRVLPLVTTKIRLLTRSYSDSIVLRWLAEDYVSYRYLATTGVNVLRVRRSSPALPVAPVVPAAPAAPAAPLAPDLLHIDTLAYGLKPLTLEQFEQRYAATDSAAFAAASIAHGDAEPSTMRSRGLADDTQELSGQQDIAYGLVMMLCETRRDIARDMAVRLTDTTAEPGAVYDYYVQPTQWENGGKLIFEPGVVEGVKCEPYEPKSFSPVVKDTLTGPRTVALTWLDDEHSSYEIDRRLTTTAMGELRNDDWTRLTSRPYSSLIDGREGPDYRVFGDSVPELGLWTYRIRGYDAFGDLSEGAEYSVFVPDIEPPLPPVLKNIVIERPDDSDPMARVIAHVNWSKAEHEPDLAGYRIYYAPMRDDGETWQAMNFDLIAPADTTAALDMTGRRTGMMYVAAYDHTGNESKSFVQQIRLTDFKAPGIPGNFRAEVRRIDIDSDSTVLKRKWAYVDLYWQPLPEDDDIDYFDVAFANDTTHTFLLRNQGGLRQSMFTDSLALNANQRYVYYKVRAVDQSTNIGEWSHWIQVERPHVTPPTQPHLGHSSHDDEQGMHMEWIVGTDADMKEHRLYRRLGDDGADELIGRYDADSVKAHQNLVIVNDNPPYSQRDRYYYWMTSTNASPFISHSLAVSWKHAGPRVVNVAVALSGSYVADDKSVMLAWDTSDAVMPEGEWYWAVFRRGPGQSRFTYYMSVEKDARYYQEHTLQPGETAEYYVHLQFADGRHSPDSNTVTVKCE